MAADRLPTAIPAPLVLARPPLPARTRSSAGNQTHSISSLDSPCPAQRLEPTHCCSPSAAAAGCTSRILPCSCTCSRRLRPAMPPAHPAPEFVPAAPAHASRGSQAPQVLPAAQAGNRAKRPKFGAVWQEPTDSSEFARGQTTSEFDTLLQQWSTDTISAPELCARVTQIHAPSYTWELEPEPANTPESLAIDEGQLPPPGVAERILARMQRKGTIMLEEPPGQVVRFSLEAPPQNPAFLCLNASRCTRKGVPTNPLGNMVPGWRGTYGERQAIYQFAKAILARDFQRAAETMRGSKLKVFTNMMAEVPALWEWIDVCARLVGEGGSIAIGSYDDPDGACHVDAYVEAIHLRARAYATQLSSVGPTFRASVRGGATFVHAPTPERSLRFLDYTRE